ncbi:MAG TPA: hypothetical protein PLN52_21230 [Opitutaceae bacterium]|nr:hypothetical protein [Opitutaceae bacterium]
MNSTVAKLLRRLASIAAVSGGASAASSDSEIGGSAEASGSSEKTWTTNDVPARGKLVFGKARRGHEHLIAHRSHSSHSSHRSHSSHYSSRSSGGSGYTAPRSSSGSSSVYVAPATIAPSPTPKPTTPPVGAPAIKINDVLKKLPRVRSHWPKEVTLNRVTKFNIVEGGKVIGVIELHAGTKVRLVEVKPEHAVIALVTGNTPLPVDYTTLIEQMGGPEKILALPDEVLVEAASPTPVVKQ